ncbi:hypothetical protein C0Z17_13470, partial [Trinickia caryophylli]
MHTIGAALFHYIGNRSVADCAVSPSTQAPTPLGERNEKARLVDGRGSARRGVRRDGAGRSVDRGRYRRARYAGVSSVCAPPAPRLL